MIYTAHPKPNSLTKKLTSLRIHPASRLIEDKSPVSESSPGQIDLELAKRIITRIEARLRGRVRQLTVYTTNNAVVLTGHCSTFYTKQLAQHTAMGVLEYERLINNIEVRVPK